MVEFKENKMSKTKMESLQMKMRKKLVKMKIRTFHVMLPRDAKWWI